MNKRAGGASLKILIADCGSSILFTLLIVILQQNGSVWIDIMLVSFKALTCWYNVMFRQVVSRYIWYPRLPISVLKELMAIFKWYKLLMVVDCLIFSFLKRKNLWLNMILLCFSFLLSFLIFECRIYELIFRMSNVSVNFSDVLFIASFKMNFDKTDSEQANLSHGDNEILWKIYKL